MTFSTIQYIEIIYVTKLTKDNTISQVTVSVYTIVTAKTLKEKTDKMISLMFLSIHISSSNL